MFRKGYYTINLHLKGEESILLRRVEASRDWYTAINQAANTSRYSTEQYSLVQYRHYSKYSTVSYITVQYSTVQYSTVQFSILHYSNMFIHRLFLRSSYSVFNTKYLAVFKFFHYALFFYQVV